MGILEITLKLLLAVALGGLIGLERESSQKPAGFRTNILICIGAAMMMVLAITILQGKETGGSEMARIAAGVITGIGFIGAGTIIQARGSVVGLTSAATLWTVAVLGLVIGYGHYIIALVYSFIIILTLIIFRKLEGQFVRKTQYRYEIKTLHSKQVLSEIKKIALHEGLKFRELKLKNEEGISIITFIFHASEEKDQEFSQTVLGLENITEIKID